MLHAKAQPIHDAIVQRLGFFPPFFEPALAAPLVLQNLWQQTRDAYLDNPLPDLFKEKLAAILSRYCTIPYCMLCHSSTLRPLGMRSRDILQLLEMPAPGFEELSAMIGSLDQQELAEDAWPEPGSELEEWILSCCVAVFLHQDTKDCMPRLRALLGPHRYPCLVLFLGYIRTCLNWAEAHPELSFEADERVQKHLGPILKEEPALRDFFANYQSRTLLQADRRTQWLTRQHQALIEQEREVRAASEASTSLMKSLLDSTVEGIWGLDLEGRITFVNTAAIKALGYQSSADLIGKNAHELVHGRYPNGTFYPKEDCPVLKALADGTSVHLENEVLWRADGTSLPIDYRSSPLMHAGKVVGAVTTFTDNTERRCILDELKHSREWLSATLKSIGDAVIATSAEEEPKIVFMNDVAEKLTGWTLEDARGLSVTRVFAIIDRHSRERALNPMARVLTDGITVTSAHHHVLIAKTGEEFIIENSASPIRNHQGEISGAVLVFRDVTARVQAEAREARLQQDVRHAQEMLAGFFMQAPVPMVIFLGPEHEFALANPPYMKSLGRNPVGRKVREIFTEEEAGRFFILLDEVYRTGVPYVGDEVLFRHPDEHGVLQEKFIQILYHPFREADGQIKGVLALVIDQTEQVLARKRVEVSEGKLSALAESVPASLMVFDADGTLEFVNKPQLDYFGKSLEFMSQGHRSELLHPDEGEAVLQDLRRHLRDGLPWVTECRLRRYDGVYRWHLARLTPYRDSSGNIVKWYGTNTDIHDQKTQAEELLKTQTNLQSALESARMGSWYCDLNPGHLTLSPVAWKILGVENPDVDATDFLAQHVHPDDRARGQALMLKTIEDHSPYLHEFRVQSPAGAMLWIVSRGKLLFGRDGKPYAVTGIIVDMTERKHTEILLRESEERYRTLFESVDQGVCILEMIFDDQRRPVDYRFLEINPTFAAQTGLVMAQGKRARELVPDLDAFWFETYGRVALTGESIRFEQDAPAMGRIFDVYAVRVGEALDGRVALLFSDITDRKRQDKNIKESEARFRTMTEVMPQIVWTALPTGEINYLNQKWSEFSGAALHTRLAESWARSVHPDDQQRAAEAWLQSQATGAMYETEFRLRHRSGQYRWGLMRAVPIGLEEGTIAEWMGTWTDIHDQKLAAEELAQAKDVAEIANAAKTAFLANMSHEIRTPLAAIIGYSEILREPDLDAAEREQYLQTVIRSGQGLTRIIDDILDLAKVEAGKLDLEASEFGLVDLMHQVLDLFRDKARSKGIDLLLHIANDLPPRIVSDATRVRQIMINLLGNAVKFTNHGEVRLTVAGRRMEDGRLWLDMAVKDTGIGMTEEQKAKIFEPFVQADSSTTRRFGGTGLGLSLSKRLARILGGDITIEASREGQGTTFLLSFLAELPAVQNSAQDIPPPMPTPGPFPSAPHQRLSGLQILVAEDSIDNQVLAQRLLARHGASVDVASDGEEAIRKALTNRFDIVLMDIQMPHVDGYEATRALRAHGYKKPIIALTAHAMAEERVRTRAAGCDGHLAKPLSQVELVRTIESHMRGSATAVHS